jgi:hypothetical protein
MSNDGSATYFRSFQQHRLLLRLLRERTIERLVSQPIKVEWLAPDGTPHQCVPHYLVECADGTIELHDIISSEHSTEEQVRLRQEALRDYCAEQGWLYKAHEERTLPTGAELANLQALILFRARCYFNAVVADAAWGLLQAVDGGPVLLGVLVDRLNEDLGLHTGVIVNALCHLLWLGELETNMDRLLFFDGALTPLATVKLPVEAQQH